MRPRPLAVAAAPAVPAQIVQARTSRMCNGLTNIMRHRLVLNHYSMSARALQRCDAHVQNALRTAVSGGPFVHAQTRNPDNSCAVSDDRHTITKMAGHLLVDE